MRIFFGFFWILTLLLTGFQVQAENGDLMIHLENHGAKAFVLEKKGGRANIFLSEDEMDQLLAEFGNYVEAHGYENLSSYDIENFFITRGYTFNMVDVEDPEYVDPQEYEMALSTLKQKRLFWTGIVILSGVLFSMSSILTATAIIFITVGVFMLGETYHSERYAETYFLEEYERKISAYYLSKTIEIRRIFERWREELDWEERSFPSIFNVSP